MQLKEIMEENDETWNEWDSIPQYILDYKEQHPDFILDPNDPPPHAIVKAIRFLKLRNLPGSLLGPHQFPLPELQVCLLRHMIFDEHDFLKYSRHSSTLCH